MCMVHGDFWKGITACRVLQNDGSASVEYNLQEACNETSLDDSLFGREMDVHNQYHVVLHSNDYFNYSEFLFPNTIWNHLPDWEIATKTLAVVPLFIFGVIGNILLLNLIFRNHHLHTPTNLLIGNMAIADLSTILICSWMFLCVDFFQNYVLGLFGCKTAGFFECFLLLTSVLNLIAISYERLTAIVVLPVEARLTLKSTYYVMSITWVVGIALGMPLIFFRSYQERQWANYFETYCAEDPSIYTYWYVVIVLVIWLPLAIMTACYIAIFIKLDRYEQQILKRESQIYVNYKTRVARVMFIVSVTFIICRVPFTALVIERSKLLQSADKNTVNEAFRVLWFTSKYLMIANSALNPIIYGLTNRNFKQAFKSTALSNWLFGPSSNITSSPKTERMAKKNENCIGCNKTTKIAEEQKKYWFTAPKHHRLTAPTTECCYI